MEKFMQTAYAKETSVELMEAILLAAGGDEEKADAIWANGPTSGELVAIVEIVTKNGMYETTDFAWGSAGENWESSLA
jgi:hypothetical protein